MEYDYIEHLVKYQEYIRSLYSRNQSMLEVFKLVFVVLYYFVFFSSGSAITKWIYVFLVGMVLVSFHVSNWNMNRTLSSLSNQIAEDSFSVTPDKKAGDFVLEMLNVGSSTAILVLVLMGI